MKIVREIGYIRYIIEIVRIREVRSSINIATLSYFMQKSKTFILLLLFYYFIFNIENI